MKIVSLAKLSTWLWEVTVPIRFDTETQVYLNGIEQVRVAYPHRMSAEVSFSVFLSDLCKESDPDDAEATINGLTDLLIGVDKREKEETT